MVNNHIKQLASQKYRCGQYALTEGQIERLLLSFTNLQDKACIALSISTGIRREDIVKIKRNDFDPENGTITFYESKKKRTRTIYIPSPETIQLLIMHLNSCRQSIWLFPSPRKSGDVSKNHVSGRHMYDVLNQQLELIGLERRPYHALRASCYKLCQKAGWSSRKACELLGDTLTVAELHYNAPSIEEMHAIAVERPLF